MDIEVTMRMFFEKINFLALIVAANIHAGESFIPMKEPRLPSSDLVFDNKVLSIDEAKNLVKSGKISSLADLNPKENDIWSKKADENYADNELRNLNTANTLDYEGAIGSQSGLFRFNVRQDGDNQLYTVHLDKTLHTLLLRAELLRSLGYKIPDIQHKKSITVRFNSESDKKKFLELMVFGTERAVSRWKVSETDREIVLKDVAITKPSENDFYNVSLGVPSLITNSRTVRSLVVPYAILDLSESIRKFSWSVGRIDNNNIILPHFLNSDFNTALEDAIWILKKIAPLGRTELRQMVERAKFPKEVHTLLVEKLYSRKNALLRAFSLSGVDTNINTKLSEGSYLKDGVLKTREFPEYATFFAVNDAETPFDQMIYFFFNKLKSEVIDNTIAAINAKISVFDLGKARADFFKSEFERGLKHFVETGELIPVGIGSWDSPYLDGTILFSRDVVVGNYLGTNNPIQIADTIGGQVDFGLHTGFEGLADYISGSVKFGNSIVRSYTHIRPLKSLKASVNESLDPIFVNILKKNLEKHFLKLNNSLSKDDSKEKAAEVQELLKGIHEKLGVGESIVMTDRMIPSVKVRAVFNQGLISASASAHASVVTIRRLHFFKRSANLLQIYNDSGDMTEIGVGFDIRKFIPILRISAERNKGTFDASVYNVNLDSDLEANPNLKAISLGVYNVLKNKNFETLEEVVKPTKISAKFKDVDVGGSFLFLRGKWQKGKAEYTITTPQGFTGKYLSMNKKTQYGYNVEAFARQIANYYIEQASEATTLALASGEASSPGDTLFGKATTNVTNYEAELTEDYVTVKRYISIAKDKQGWSSSNEDIVQFMKDTNAKFQTELFNPNVVDFKKLRLYNFNYIVNFYEKGIKKIQTIDEATITQLEKKYQATTRNCNFAGEASGGNQQSALCGNLWEIKSLLKSCPKEKKYTDQSECHMKLAERLFEDLDFADFKLVMGGDSNYYVYASVDGYREKSEILNESIYSNSIGTISSKNVSGPMDTVRSLIGVMGGELSGAWIRK